MKVVLFVGQDGYWYLDSKSNLNHSFHPPTMIDGKCSISPGDLNEPQVDFMKEMFCMGISNTSIASIMTNVLNKDGKDGALLVRTVHTLNRKHKQALDMIRDISPDWSVAERMVVTINR